LILPDAPPASATRTAYPASAHQIHEYLHIAAVLGAKAEIAPPFIAVRVDETWDVALKFNLPMETGTRRVILGLNPGAEYGPAKRWPAEHFIAAAREIHKRLDCVWLVLGSQADLPITMGITSAIRSAPAVVHNLAGQTTVRELCAVLKLCRAVLTNDSGPMHLAAAVGTPVVVPFGSTSPELTGPGLPGGAGNHLLTAPAPCAPCFRRTCPIDFRCMAGISVERVVEAVTKAVGEVKQ
jgi:heptosyltransferase-2